jgi:hypothetical protein
VKIFRLLGAPFRPFLKFSTFLGLKEIKGSYQNMSGMAKELIKPDEKPAIINETFEEAKARLNLSEQDLAQRQKSFLRTSIGYLVGAVLLVGYMLYLLFTGVLMGVFIAFVLVFVALAFGYKEHFWYTQMRHRRLGLTFRDWKNYTFSGRNK